MSVRRVNRGDICKNGLPFLPRIFLTVTMHTFTFRKVTLNSQHRYIEPKPASADLTDKAASFSPGSSLI